MKNKLYISAFLLVSTAAIHGMDGQSSSSNQPPHINSDNIYVDNMNTGPFTGPLLVQYGNFSRPKPQDDRTKSTASKIVENFNEGMYKGIESAPQVAIQTAVTILTKEAVSAAFSAVRDYFYSDDANRRLFSEKLEALNTDGQHLQLVAKIISKQLSDLDDLIASSNNTRLKKVYEFKRKKVEKDLETLLLTSLNKLQKQTLELISLKSAGAQAHEFADLETVETDEQTTSIIMQDDMPKTAQSEDAMKEEATAA